MITIKDQGDQFVIRHHYPMLAGSYACVVQKKNLPSSSAQQLSSLVVADGFAYPLTQQQHTTVRAIFEKIQAEEKSTYRFTEQLKKTYIIELIHLITKIHSTIQPACMN